MRLWGVYGRLGTRTKRCKAVYTEIGGSMSVIIPNEIVQATRMSESELYQEIAVLLFAKDKLTLGQASQLAKMNQIQFQHLLASKKIPVHYDVSDLKKDLNTLEKMGVVCNTLPYGGGDYTKERHGWLDQQSFEELAKPPKKATDRKT